MKTSLFASILLSTLFYTNLLSTMFVMSVVLVTRDPGMAPVARDAQVWERSHLYAPAMVEPHRKNLRPPQTDAPIDESGSPDAAMIKPGKGRAKTIKV